MRFSRSIVAAGGGTCGARSGGGGQVCCSKRSSIGRGDEARAARVQVPVAARRLLRDVEALRHQQVQVVAGPGHGHVEQPPLFFESRCAPCATSAGMQPSTTLSTCTDVHSWPLAEWMVERIR